MRKILAIILILFLAYPLYALEVVRQKNTASYIVYPIVGASGDTVTSAAGLDSEYNYWEDGSAPQASYSDTAGEATEIGSTGVYYLALSAAELNHGYIAVQTKTTTANAKTQHLLIRTLVGDPLNLATTDDGGTINVTAGKVDSVVTADVTTLVNGLGANVITAASINTDAIGADELAAGGNTEIGTAVWASGTRTLTAGTNIVLAKNTNITGFNDVTSDAIWAYTSRTLTAGTNLNDIAATDVWAAGTRTLTDLGSDVYVQITGDTTTLDEVTNNYLLNIYRNTNGEKDSGEYQSLEKMIRQN